jgi:hypothetical protein
MTIKYAMRSEGRARPVSKDIVKLAREFGLEIKLSAAQQAAARLFGYRNWNDMVAAFTDEEQGPEDHQLAASDLAIRQSHQKQVLGDLGFPQDEAEDVLKRLRPTGRADGAVEANSRIGRVADYSIYHPYRFDRAYEIVSFMTDVPDIDGMDLDLFFSGYLREWAETRPLLFLDRLTIEEPKLMERILGNVFDFDRHNLIIDGSAMAKELSTQQVPSSFPDGVFSESYIEEIEEFEDITLTYYVHFGEGIFDSPYDNAWIDGAYVAIQFYYGIPWSVTATLIAADATPTAGYGEPTMRNALRAHPITLECEIGEQNWIGLAISDYFQPRDASEVREQMWQPYSMAPLLAAFNAFQRYHAPGTRRAFYIPKNEKPESAARFERSVTFEETQNAIIERSGRPVICHLGGPAKEPRPKTVPRLAGPGRGRDKRYERLAREDFETFVADGHCMRTREGYKLAALKAMEIAEYLARTETCDVLVEAHANLIGAALLSGDTDLAVAGVRWFEDTYIDHSDIEARFRPLVATALVLDGKRDLAAEIVDYPADVWPYAYEAAREVLEETGEMTPSEIMVYLQDWWRAESLVTDEGGLELSSEVVLPLKPE